MAVKRENEMLRLSSDVIKVCDFRQHNVRLSAADAADCELQVKLRVLVLLQSNH